MYDAWKADSRALLPFDVDEARKAAGEITAKVLSNRKPPYSISGGLFDALKATNGDVVAVTNDEAAKAAQLFETTEGIDIHPAAAVATASLIKYVENKQLDTNATIMLNITGGGEKRFKTDNDIIYLKPNHVFDIDTPKEEVEKVLKEAFK